MLATASVVARLTFRKTSRMQCLSDDYFIVIAALFANADASLYLWNLRYGFGHHIYMLDLPTRVNFFKVVFAISLLYSGAVFFVKFSVLAFYVRILPNTKFRTRLISLGIFSGRWWVTITLVSILQCRPVQKAWNDDVEGTCVSYPDLSIATQVVNIILDTAILVMPISTVLKLQTNRVGRTSAAAAFALGGL